MGAVARRSMCRGRPPPAGGRRHRFPRSDILQTCTPRAVRCLSAFVLSLVFGACDGTAAVDALLPDTGPDAAGFDLAPGDGSPGDGGAPDALSGNDAFRPPDGAVPDGGASRSDGAAAPDGGTVVPAGENVIDGATYLILTNAAMQPAFERLAHWRRQTGTPVRIVLVDEIERAGTRDLAEAVRRRIQSAVANEGTRIVLLGGDANVIPGRTIYVHTTLPLGAYAYETGDNAPSELYFSDLDGTWDGDGDGRYGEFADDLDMRPDVAVGRVPAASLSEADAYVDKVLAYEQAQSADYQQRVLFLSEPTGFGDIDSAVLLDRWQGRIVDARYSVQKLYENYEPFADARPNTAAAEIAALTQGQGFVVHFGHGDVSTFAYLDGDDVDALQHAPRYNVFFSTACYSGDFTAGGGDSTGERYVLNPRGGGVAYVGNTDVGIGFPPGAGYLQELVSRLLADGEPPRLGEAFAAARMTFVADGAGSWTDDNAVRYTQFVLILLGDPGLRMWRTRPVPAVLGAPSQTSAAAPLHVTVVTGAAVPAPGVTVSVYQAGATLLVGRSDASGEVVFPAGHLRAGSATVTASGRDIAPIERTVSIVSP